MKAGAYARLRSINETVEPTSIVAIVASGAVWFHPIDDLFCRTVPARWSLPHRVLPHAQSERMYDLNFSVAVSDELAFLASDHMVIATFSK
jgi:hypothetical protein